MAFSARYSDASACPLAGVQLDPEMLQPLDVADAIRSRMADPAADAEDRDPEAWRWALAHAAGCVDLSPASSAAMVAAIEALEALLAATAALRAAGLALAEQLEAPAA